MVKLRFSPSTVPEANQDPLGGQSGMDSSGGELAEGARVGRFVIVRDVEGRTHAIAAGAVGTVCQTEEGALLLLPGGRLVHVPRPMATVLAWLDGRPA